jgi:hypothetical protein
MQNGEYSLCFECIGNHQDSFESARRGLEVQRSTQERLAEVRKKYPTPQPPAGVAALPDMGQLATNNFVGQIHKLVEILVATSHQDQAAKIRDQAILVLDDPRLKSAVSDAETKLKIGL